MLAWGVCRKARRATSVTAGSSATAWKAGTSTMAGPLGFRGLGFSIADVCRLPTSTS
jgi:hypothetical protein